MPVNAKNDGKNDREAQAATLAQQEEIVQALLDDLKVHAPEIERTVEEDFNSVLKSVLTDMFDDREAIETAFALRSFVIEQIVVKIRAQHGIAEVVGDIGRPAAYENETVFRQLLEMNNDNFAYAGVKFAVDPESGQLIAIALAPMVMASDRQVLLELLDNVMKVVKAVRKGLAIEWN